MIAGKVVAVVHGLRADLRIGPGQILQYPERVLADVLLHLEGGDAERRADALEPGQVPDDLLQAAVDVEHRYHAEHHDDRDARVDPRLDHVALLPAAP
ncbi:hypothetical protein G039_0310750 [Pseudomonas aeruginosa VRFPA01]|nr:hypothetical protein G039_0310750 [Pseudomonas aeruginosa VRFPA01]